MELNYSGFVQGESIVISLEDVARYTGPGPYNGEQGTVVELKTGIDNVCMVRIDACPNVMFNSVYMKVLVPRPGTENNRAERV